MRVLSLLLFFFYFFFTTFPTVIKIEKTHCAVFALNPDKEMRVGWMLLFYQTTPMRVNGSMIRASGTYYTEFIQMSNGPCMQSHALFIESIYVRNI
jgi:hypothetical protein